MIIFIIGDICRENKVFFHTDAAQVKKLILFLFPKNVKPDPLFLVAGYRQDTY